jgi:hypothetical protein
MIPAQIKQPIESSKTINDVLELLESSPDSWKRLPDQIGFDDLAVEWVLSDREGNEIATVNDAGRVRISNRCLRPLQRRRLLDPGFKPDLFGPYAPPNSIEIVQTWGIADELYGRLSGQVSGKGT